MAFLFYLGLTVDCGPDFGCVKVYAYSCVEDNDIYTCSTLSVEPFYDTGYAFFWRCGPSFVESTKRSRCYFFVLSVEPGASIHTE
jgi:hypothetical protein